MLVTRAQVKSYMGLSGVTYDNRIDGFLAMAESSVPAWCKRRLAYEDRTKIFNGKGGAGLILDLYPVYSFVATEVWISGSFPRTFGDAEKLGNDEFIIDPESGIVELSGGAIQWAARGSGGGGYGWPCGTQNIKVHWAGGYWPADGGAKTNASIEDVPGGLREAIEIIVADKLSRSIQLESGQAQAELASEGITGQQMVSYRKGLDDASGFPIQAAARLQAFRFSL